MSGSKPLTTREQTKLNQNIKNDPLVGQVIGGHYEVLECIGKGGMSAVYKTRHQLINQLRAVKVLLPHRDAASDFLLRFQLEATAASRLDNPHIVRIHDFASPPDSAPYLVMDFAEGVGLGDEIDRLGHIPVKRALYIFHQLLDAIGHTHLRGVIHRDLKPDNILLVDDEIGGEDFVKLIDFGIAKLTAADKLQPQGLTPTGEVFGSPQYMSPEQCAGLTMDVRSEIYSLGCMLYEMLSGRAPLLGKSVLETLNMQAHVEATPVSKLPIEPPIKLPRGLDEIVMKCLAKKPSDRFQSTEELAAALEKIQPATPPGRFGQSGSNKTKNGVTRKKDQAPRAPSNIISLPMVAGLTLTFALGFGMAKLQDLAGAVGAGAKKEQAATQTATGGASQAEPVTPQLEHWHSLTEAGQNALDRGDLDSAASQLEEALNVANSLNDGQKHSAATGIDLASLDIIKQFKNPKQDEAAKVVAVTETYPNHPWATKVSALVELLHEKPEKAEEQKAILRSTLEVLENPYKGNLSGLNGVINLAAKNIAAYNALTARDEMRLAIAIAGVQEEQGYHKKAQLSLEKYREELNKLGPFDPLTARFYLLDGKLALNQGDLDAATGAIDKADQIYRENLQDHPAEISEINQLRSDVALVRGHADESLSIAKQALAAARDWKAPPESRLDLVKDRLFMRAATIEPATYLEQATQRCHESLAEEEGAVPKNLNHLITDLSLSDLLQAIAAGARSKAGPGGAPGSTRPMLWRAVALAYQSGRMAEASRLMHPLLLSYDTPLTQKELLKLAANRLIIDNDLASAGNNNGADLLEDYVYLSEVYQDFSLGAARDLKKAHYFLEHASGEAANKENRKSRLLVAHVYYDQARLARDRKDMPALVTTFLDEAQKELRKNDHLDASQVDEQVASAALLKKVNDMEQEIKRLPQ